MTLELNVTKISQRFCLLIFPTMMKHVCNGFPLNNSSETPVRMDGRIRMKNPEFPNLYTVRKKMTNLGYKYIAYR